ncbi:hypothetical protein [Ruegeria sp.]|uniref:hypothetical protein n=1 Tax=Ruegeria sp. TaxID=1879320 RepID=UPI003AFFE442
MPRKIGIDSDGVRSTALRGTDAPDDATRADCPPEAQAGGDIPPPDMEIKAMEREVSLTRDMSGVCNMRSVRFYSVSERRRYEPSRSVTGSSTDEV